MPRVRKIQRDPASKNYYVVDANFLANRHIPPNRAPAGPHRDRIKKCNEWWDEIEAQLTRGRARVYIPDVCIAETFKVLAKKYYEEKWFKSATEHNNARNRLRQKVSTPARVLRAASRHIKYHDVETSRDVIIAVDRFYELFNKHQKRVSVNDLLLLATAKYLVDFFDIPKEYLHIVTLDRQLRDGSKKIQELPNAYDPTISSDAAQRVFV